MGKITRQELSNGLKSELNKSGNLSELSTVDKTNLVNAINEVKNEQAVHLAETMPHKFTDGGKNYKYGFKINPNKDGLIFAYEEVL